VIRGGTLNSRARSARRSAPAVARVLAGAVAAVGGPAVSLAATALPALAAEHPSTPAAVHARAGATGQHTATGWMSPGAPWAHVTAGSGTFAVSAPTAPCGARLQLRRRDRQRRGPGLAAAGHHPGEEAGPASSLATKSHLRHPYQRHPVALGLEQQRPARNGDRIGQNQDLPRQVTRCAQSGTQPLPTSTSSAVTWPLTPIGDGPWFTVQLRSLWATNPRVRAMSQPSRVGS
jgi:hypothetical protein